LRLKRFKVKVTRRSNMVRKGTLGILKVMHSNIVVTDNLSGEDIMVKGSPSRTIQFLFLSGRTYFQFHFIIYAVSAASDGNCSFSVICCS